MGRCSACLSSYDRLPDHNNVNWRFGLECVCGRVLTENAEWRRGGKSRKGKKGKAKVGSGKSWERAITPDKSFWPLLVVTVRLRR